jgi:exopolysaccharide/PEP-CTERM locus tyrosine autokinase
MKMKSALEKSPLLFKKNGNGAVPDGSDPPIPMPIVYTQTRAVSVSPSVLRDRRIVAALESNPFSDAYKILRTQVLQRMRENGWNLLGITSPGGGEGKTLTAVNLAVSLAMEVSQTVLLVDADLRSPSIHTMFDLKRGRGLVDHLLDQTPVADLLVHPCIQRLVLLPGGRPMAGSSELLTSPPMRTLVNELKHRYTSRIVLFDLPPLLNSADVLAFAPLIDTLLLVVEAGRTQVEDVERSLSLMSEVPIVGTVLNKG